MQWLQANWGFIALLLLFVSECAALIVRSKFPENKGAAGIIDGIVQFLRMITGKQVQVIDKPQA